MAAFSPSWASEITSLTPQAAPGEGAQELDPKRLGLAVADRHAQHLAAPVAVDADGNDDGNRDDAVVTRALT